MLRTKRLPSVYLKLVRQTDATQKHVLVQSEPSSDEVRIQGARHLTA